MKMRYCVLATCLFWAVAADRRAQAGSLVVSNIDQPPAAADTITPYDPTIGQFGFAAAQEFNTGSLATSLDRVFASIGNYNAGTDFQLTATLEADSSGMPSGTPLVTFTFNVAAIPTSGFANVEFDPLTPFSLAAGTNYWFVLNGTSTDGSGGVDWQWTNSTISVGPGSLTQFNNSYDGGTTWNGPFSGSPYLMQVNGLFPVPEPTAWVLLSIGFAGVAGLSQRWRSRRSRNAGSRAA
jgi:hypothetical protein